MYLHSFGIRDVGALFVFDTIVSRVVPSFSEEIYGFSKDARKVTFALEVAWP